MAQYTVVSVWGLYLVAGISLTFHLDIWVSGWFATIGSCLAPPTGNRLLWMVVALHLLYRGLVVVVTPWLGMLLLTIVGPLRLFCLPLTSRFSLSALPYRAYPLSCCLLD